MKEIWKDVEGYKGLYKVSNQGQILSVKFGPKNINPVYSSPKIMRQSLSSSGYRHVQLYLNGVAKTKLVHILVAQAFLPNPDKKPEVNHKDGNKLNNDASNLEWVTISENQIHAIKAGLRKASPNLGRTGVLNKSSKPVLQYTLQGNFIKKWDCQSDAARFYNCKPNCISACTRGARKTFLGFIWRPYNGEKIQLKIPQM